VAEVGGTRSGFVALAGRPNVGKSTLVNAMVGRKVAIVSDKPQTTRRAIRGVATRGDAQIVLTDLPGVQRPRDELTRRMQHRVEQELGEADSALFVVNGDQGVGGPGDVWIAEALRAARVPVVIAVNKVDRTSNPRTVAALQAAADLGLDAEVFPISARTGCCRRGRSTSRPRRSPTSRSRCCWPSSCASRCSPARARSCRIRSRCRWTRSRTAAT
jgi:GTP-binding protein Era